MAQRPPRPLLENLITLLAHHEQGRSVAHMVTAELFEGDYRLVAERCLAFWHDHDTPPAAHIADLFPEFESDDPRSSSLRRILSDMDQLKSGLNVEYTLTQITTFIRVQTMKQAVLKAAEVLQRGAVETVGEVETILGDLLRSRTIEFDPGLDLGAVDDLLAYWAANREHGIALAIAPLDKANIQLRHGTILCLIGASGVGKSWFLCHAGTRALRARQKVLHISLEMASEEVLARYYQSLFGVSARQTEEGIRTARLEVEHGRIKDVTREVIDTDFALDWSENEVARELRTRIELLGGKASSLRIKRFPPRVLTLGMLEAFLDTLEQSGFIPDLLSIDYPQLMKTDPNNYRISLGQNIEGLRGICVERNMAGIIVHQANREGAKAKQVHSTHIGEDWSVVQTCDAVLTLSATDPERAMGLARLYVAKARTDRDRFSMLLTQNYEIGQFCLSASLMPTNYEEYLRDHHADEDDESDDGPQEAGKFG